MPAKKVRNVKKRDPLRRKYGIPTLNDKKRHALRHPGFIAPKPVSHIEENQRRIAELESKLRDKSSVVVGGTTVGGQVQPQPWVYKKPDAKESDPLSMVTNIAEQLGANSTLTTILKTAGRMSKADQDILLGYLNQGVNFVGKGIGAVLNTLSTPAETEAQKIEREQALAKARASGSNTTPPAPPLANPIPKPPVIPLTEIKKGTNATNATNAANATDGLPKVTQNVVPTESFEEKDNGLQLTDSDSNSDSNKGRPELYLTNASAQVESFTPAEIEQQRQSSVLPITYPTPISQPTSAAPTPAAQPVDNSEVSNLDYMKSVVLTAIAASAAAFQNFLFDNPLLADTVQKAVVQGAKTVGDVLPYLRQYINGLPREEIRQRFRRTMV